MGCEFSVDKAIYSPQNPLVIAELGTSHGSSLSKAKEMAQAAAEAGAGCVKLQMVFADEILHPNTGEVTLPGGKIRLYDRFRQLEMPLEFYAEAKEYIESLELLFLCTPFGLKSAKILHELQPKIVKIASPELNFTCLLQEIAQWGLPVLLSSGVSTLGDIEEAVEILRGSGEWGVGSGDKRMGTRDRGLGIREWGLGIGDRGSGNVNSDYHSSSELYSNIPNNNPQSLVPPKNSTRTGERVDKQMLHGVGQIKAPATVKSEGPPTPHSLTCLLHCVTAYPAPETDYNLRVLQSLAAVLGLSVGVSDHSLDPELVPALAISQGAAVVEKHFCLSRDDPGLDDPIALPPLEFARMVMAVRQAAEMEPGETIALLKRERGIEPVEVVLGSGIKTLAPPEKENYKRTNRSIHAMRDIHPGEIIDDGDFAILRTEKVLRPGLAPSLAANIIGRTARQFIPSGEGIRFEDI
jgi:sialic acid synthase SpsE